jgi:hypothetical protein
MSKKDYRVRNWKDYNEALVQRGSVTLWFSEESIKNWHEPKKENGRGRPQEYSELAIICGLTIKAVFKLAYRATEGFIRSLVGKLQLGIKVPDYTLLCKRQKDVKVVLPKKVTPGEALHIVCDSTGLKVFGEGEWKTRRHGPTKKRLWRKLHLAINSKTQMIEACELTELGVQDSEGFKSLLNSIKEPISVAIGDGSYDRFSCYEEMEKRGGKGIFPPQRNAVTSVERMDNKKKASQGAVEKRDGVINQVRLLGRKTWKQQSGYHRRSLAETGMFRVKTLLGRRLTCHTFKNQCVEAKIWCNVVNRMTLLGMPKTVVV